MRERGYIIQRQSTLVLYERATRDQPMFYVCEMNPPVWWPGLGLWSRKKEWPPMFLPACWGRGGGASVMRSVTAQSVEDDIPLQFWVRFAVQCADIYFFQ